MRFSDITGKEELKRRIANAVDIGRLPHAQILLGKEGSGGLPTALALASYIMCENKTDGDSCGHCSHCKKSLKYIHPDIHFSFPVVKFGDKKREHTTSDDFLVKWRKILSENAYMGIGDWLEYIDAGNSNPNINVKECNDIMTKLNMMSYESDKKVLVMWLPEYLGNEGNRLLKLIEEPTDNTYIILVAENQDLILQTILSRCQLVKIPVYESNEISQFLVDKYEILKDKADQIANLADGNINLAIQIGTNESKDFSDMLITWLRVAYKSDPIEINNWVSSVTEMNKDEQKNFFEYGLHFFRQFVFRMLTGNDKVSLTAKELEIAGKMTSIINADKAEFIADKLNAAIECVGRNINIRIMLYADTLAIGDVIRKN